MYLSSHNGNHTDRASNEPLPQKKEMPLYLEHLLRLLSPLNEQEEDRYLSLKKRLVLETEGYTHV